MHKVDPFQRQFLGQYLAAEARTIAADAAERLIDRNPDVSVRFSPQPAAKWRVHLEGWATDLAAAINVDCPDLFASRLRWCAVAFAARSVPHGDLKAALEAFRYSLGRHVPKEDVPVLSPYFDAAERFLNDPTTMGGPEDAVERLSRLSMSVLVAVLEGERLQACGLVMEAIRTGTLSAGTVHSAVVAPVMREVGRLWHLGELSVAEEHFATATMQTLLAQVQMFMPKKPKNGRTLLAASVEGNSHELGIRVLADAFEAEGWRTIFLGGSVPIEDVAQAVIDFDVHLVALSATLSQHLHVLGDAVAAAKSARPENPPRVIVGGAALSMAPGAWKELGADACATSPSEAIALAAEMFGLSSEGGSGR